MDNDNNNLSELKQIAANTQLISNSLIEFKSKKGNELTAFHRKQLTKVIVNTYESYITLVTVYTNLEEQYWVSEKSNAPKTSPKPKNTKKPGLD